MPGVSVVVPVRNGAPWIARVLDAILGQSYAGPVEVIVIDDGSTDESRAIAGRYGERVVMIDGPGRGAAAALNAGIRRATHPFIAQVDQDVVVGQGWLVTLAEALADPGVAAAQGHYVAAPDAGIWARATSLDLAARYARLGPWTNHVCTGNTLYRRAALIEADLFDESLGYGYDNDMSYRLVERGWQLAFRTEARSTHFWRDTFAGYARQQYGQGYGRLDLVAAHPGRLAGDNVSPAAMMLHAPVTGAAVAAALAVVPLVGAGASGAAQAAAIVAGTVAAALVGERAIAGIAAARRFRDAAGFWFAPVHLVRDLAWVTAIVVWSARRLTGGRTRPSHSMTTRPSPALAGRATTACEVVR